VQAPRDANYAAYIASHCKNPPAQSAAPPARPPAPAPEHRDYKVTAIPGVIDAGKTWKTVWTGTGNNADGPVATADGGMLFAQNTNSRVLKLDANGNESFPYTGTSTSGALSMNKNGALFVLQRALPEQIWQLEPKKQLLMSEYKGEPIDCAGGLLNDMTADSKGGVYFSKGGVFYSDAKGTVTQYGTLAGANGIILSPDEKTLYVTGRLASTPTEPVPAGAPPGARPGGLVAFDVQADGSLTNERQFALVGGDLHDGWRRRAGRRQDGQTLRRDPVAAAADHGGVRRRRQEDAVRRGQQSAVRRDLHAPDGRRGLQGPREVVAESSRGAHAAL
jgi:hypothetical protein